MKFATPLQTEAAYYKAFSKADFSSMKEIWLDSSSVSCTHPMAERIVGYPLVIGSFLGLFRNQGDTIAWMDEVETVRAGDLSIHTGVEVLQQDGQEFRMQVTNVYRSTDDGWRMILHHSSPVHSAPLYRPQAPGRSERKLH